MTPALAFCNHNEPVLLARVAATSSQVAATAARSRKVELVTSCLRDAAPEDVVPLVSYLSGDLPQRALAWDGRLSGRCRNPPTRPA